MAPIQREDPKRPFRVGKENENENAQSDKDHVSNQPESNDMVETGDKASPEGDGSEEPE